MCTRKDEDRAQDNLELALVEMHGIADVLTEIGKHLEASAAAYLGSRLTEACGRAHDAADYSPTAPQKAMVAPMTSPTMTTSYQATSKTLPAAN